MRYTITDRTDRNACGDENVAAYYPDPLHPEIAIPIAPTISSSFDASFESTRQDVSGPDWGSLVAEYIQMLPTVLIRTSDMTLMGRAAVQRHVQADIEAKVRKQMGRVRDEPTMEELRDWRRAIQDYAEEVLGYAVLSHRWQDCEPTFQEMLTRRQPEYDPPADDTSAAWRKLHRFCDMARMHGCSWAWADTCCIDKTNSADLDEAIRSMYRWYKHAKVCIVYLADTVVLGDLSHDAWFTRGWTLQELLAPSRIKFFNRHWLPLTRAFNDKDAASGLLDTLSKITGIPRGILLGFIAGTDMIREKMCWAAKRKTTRVEDIAYSLIGLFDVTLMTAYGEGERAFYRLQLAIMEKSNAVDLLVWSGEASRDNTMIARSPAHYSAVPAAGVLHRRYKPRVHGDRAWSAEVLWSMPIVRGGRSYAMTNAGLRLDVVLYDVTCSFVPHRTKSTVVDVTEPVIHIGVHAASIPDNRNPFRWQTTLAILDYESSDFNEDDPMMTKEIKAIISARRDRTYSGVLLRKVIEISNLDRYYRQFPRLLFSVRRPGYGWRVPETVYIV